MHDTWFNTTNGDQISLTQPQTHIYILGYQIVHVYINI